MTKSKTLLSISCLMLLVMSRKVSLCPKEGKLPGPCEDIGGRYLCYIHFLGKYGLESKPQNCKCSPSGSDQKMCYCEIIC
uniref:Uncharacterized protein n=1 Tax=Manihot esculenta TaxID=3983 RepID=A0A2C9V7Q5_MANES